MVMAFGDEVSCSSTFSIFYKCDDYASDESNNCDYDDETEILLLIMHESLKEACERNRKLQEKNDALTLANSKLVRELNTAKDICKKLQEREKYYNYVRKEHNILKKKNE